MKLKTLFLLFIAMIFIYTTNVNAEIRPGSYSISPTFGSYFFDGDEEVLNTITYGLILGHDLSKRWTVEAAYNVLNTEDQYGINDVDAGLLRGEVLYNLLTGDRFVPYLAAGPGYLFMDKIPGGGDYSGATFDYGLGAKYFFTENVAMRADLRHVIGFPENNVLYTVGLVFAFGGEKPAPVVVKEAPKAAPVAAPVVEAPKDSDGDGVTDDKDQCPNTAKGVKVDSKGCPLDSDGDGVTDDKDQCPNTAKGVKVDSKGCPLDSDKDGVTDDKDQCPNTPAGAKVDSKGCQIDSDGDGVYDEDDQCPNTPKGASVDPRGCWSIGNINFDFNKADVKTEYSQKLDTVVSVLQQNTSLNITIDGHTDSKGTDSYNQKLSEKRAKSVMEYFANKGIDKARLTVKGYGESKPIESNDTDEGRAENRRVELTPVQ